MKVGLKEIKEFPAKVSIFEEKEDVGFAIEGLTIVDGVNVTLSIQQTETEYYIQGYCSAQVELTCARCLEPARERIRGELEMIAIREGGSAERFAGVEDVAQLDDREELEFSEQVRQVLFAEMPLKPLCDPDCLGLCPSCGENRNTTPCNCLREKTDSRWDALKGLIE